MTIYDIAIVQAIHRWDVSTFLKVNKRLRDKYWLKAAETLSHTADGWGYLLIPLVLMMWSPQQGKMFFVVSAVAFLIERSIYFTLKNSLKRRRPPQAIPGFKSFIIASDEFSFPSGHTSGAFLMVTLACIYISPLLAIAYIWAMCIGACRIILGVHFPTDTAMGAIMGSSVAILTSILLPNLL